MAPRLDDALEVLRSLFTAERAFVNSARRDLGLADVDAPPFPDTLVQIDDTLMEAHHDRSAGPPPNPR